MNGMAGNGDIFLLLAYYLVYTWCASRFLKIQLQAKQWEERVFAGLLFCNYGLIVFFLTKTEIPYILHATYSYMVLILLTLAVLKGENEKKLLAAVIWSVMSRLIWNFSESFFSCLWLILNHILTLGQPFPAAQVWADIFITIMTYGTGITAFSLLSKPIQFVLSDKRKSWYLCVTVPLSCVVLITDLVNWAASNGIMVHDWGQYGLYENQLFSHGAMCIFTGLAMMAAGLLVFGMDRIDREDQAKEQYQSQVMYYQMMEEQYSQMERLRHDMKNHMIALDNLMRNHQWEQADRYRMEMAKAGGIAVEDEVTGSLVIDALLYHKRKQAADKGIRWQCDAKLPANCPIKEIDLCIMIGNILDNALEACIMLPENSWTDTAGNKPFIHVFIGTIKKCLFLEVKNSADLADGQKADQHRKKEPGKHGLGLGNMKASAANYNGVVHMEAENNQFTISILLPLYQESSSESMLHFP